MSRPGGFTSRTFDALNNYNYRLYFFGQIVSVSGTWMQSVAQAWLVLRISHNSGIALGAVTAVQFLPILLAGPMGGVIADRVDKRRLLVATQTAAGLLALTLGLLTLTGAVQLWMVFLLAFGLGCVNAADNPSRQSFVMEMVGQDRVTNAVTLNSVVMNGARVVGPAVAGFVIETSGLAVCFLANAGSFAAVIVGLMLMRRHQLLPATPIARKRGQLREGWHYTMSDPALRTPLIMMAVVGTLAYNFTVTLPLMAKFAFHAGAGAFGLMNALMGAGAVVGGLITASRGDPGNRRLPGMAAAFGVFILVCAVMPNLATELAALAVMGAFSISFIATANTTLQLRAAPEMRGRVMALYAVAFLGSTPVGGPIVGTIGQTVGAREALAVGGVATLAAAIFGFVALAGARPAWRRRTGPTPNVPELAVAELSATEASGADAVAASMGADPGAGAD